MSQSNSRRRFFDFWQKWASTWFFSIGNRYLWNRMKVISSYAIWSSNILIFIFILFHSFLRIWQANKRSLIQCYHLWCVCNTMSYKNNNHDYNFTKLRVKLRGFHFHFMVLPFHVSSRLGRIHFTLFCVNVFFNFKASSKWFLKHAIRIFPFVVFLKCFAHDSIIYRNVLQFKMFHV